VVGIDNSPLAIQVCRDRGLADARVVSTTRITSALGLFDGTGSDTGHSSRPGSTTFARPGRRWISSWRVPDGAVDEYIPVEDSEFYTAIIDKKRA
jgi:hypothetical protein